MDASWKSDLEHWLAPFLDALRHRVRAWMCPAYVAGLIGAGERKSIQPMAARNGEVGYDQLHHFITSGVWDAAPLEKVLLAEADRMIGGADAWLIVDDTALPKKGERSVGVAPQYASALGKTANCQTLVSLTLASGEVPVMVGLRLFLPESWTSDPARLARAGVPDDHAGYRSKPEIALADAGYGLSAPFRQALSARGLTWAVGIGARQKVYPVDGAPVFPASGRGRPRKNPVPDATSVPAEKMLATARWRALSWRRGTKGPLKARFAAVRIGVADGPPQRIGAMGQQHLPGEEAWLIGERHSNGERKYYLSNLPAGTPLKRLAGAIKARWICEQAHQQLKEELGLDHFEGRSWTGLHRHALMTMIAYAFLQSRRLKQAKREKKKPGSAAPAHPAGDPRGHHRQARAVTENTVPALPQTNRTHKYAKVVLGPFEKSGVGVSAD